MIAALVLALLGAVATTLWYRERMRARAAAQVLDLQGLPAAPLGEIVLSDCRFDGVTKPSVIAHAPGLRLERVTVNGRRAPSPAALSAPPS